MDENKTKNDDWKIHLFWIGIVAAILFFDGRDDRATLKQVGEIREWADIVRSDTEKLNNATSRFDTENWQDVVPSVKQAAEDLVGTTELLSIEIGKLEEDLTAPPPDPGDYDPR